MSATGRNLIIGCLVVATYGLAGIAGAQVLEAFDDLYGIPFGRTLVVDPFGVMDNDRLDGENAGESGATVSLVSDVSHGTLALAADGSFTYQVGGGFDGTDEFVYRIDFESASDEATVTLSACDGGPGIITCWHETAFAARAQALGYSIFHEGFEDDAVGGGVRTPQAAPSVISQGIEWRSNHPDAPASNPISTTSGPPHSGQWAVYDPDHGYATGSEAECDTDNPPEHCLYHDGVSGTRVPGQEALHGVGGYFHGLYGANVGILIDGAGPLGGGTIAGDYPFFGVIDTRPAGFTQFEFRELDGKIGQALYVWADDFSLAGNFSTGTPEWAVAESVTRVSPNPARRSTTVRYSLESPARIRLDIYDIAGRLVRSLKDEYRDAGSHAIDWDLRDRAGLDVASGVYFARLAMNRSGLEIVNSRKIVVIE